jgi:hypothetical protein
MTTDTLQTLRDFLLCNSFKDLYEMYGVAARPSKDVSKWSLNYDQIASKPGCPVASVCRGLVIRPKTQVTDENQVVGDFDIVARPMDRFYNDGESCAARIDWPTARVEEKLDGTMILLYWDNVKLEWCVATRSVPEADVSFGDPPGSPLLENTFSNLFWYSLVQTLSVTFPEEDCLEWTAGLNTQFTYIFELTSPLNRVIVKYDDYRVTILAIRHTEIGQYHEPGYTLAYSVPTVNKWSLKAAADIHEFVNKADPAKLEGAVVVDKNYNRLKIKSKAWVLASRAKDSVTMSKRNALQCIIDGQIDDVIPLLDTHVSEYMVKLKDNFHNLCKSLDGVFQSFSLNHVDRKEFALAVQSSGLWQAPFFALYSGKAKNVLDWLRQLSKNDKLTPTMLDTILSEIDK